jgi:hypothetical protein
MFCIGFNFPYIHDVDLRGVNLSLIIVILVFTGPHILFFGMILLAYS